MTDRFCLQGKNRVPHRHSIGRELRPTGSQHRHIYFGTKSLFLHQMLMETKDNNYLYNYKELNADHDLKWYDYGARFYDAVIGRWHVVDPMGEKYQIWSIYNYGKNNPLRHIDPDGRKVDDIIISQRNKDKNNYAAKTFGLLQKLTSDKLAMDGNGKVTIVEVGSGNANATAEGTKLVGALINDNSKTVVIETESTSTPPINLDKNATTTANNGINASNGVGTGSKIEFSPNVKAKIETTDCAKVPVPAERVLAHELIHADNNRTGTREVSGMPKGDFTSTKEEQKTVQRENLMFKIQRYDGTNGSN
ncbi:MAG: RHS repeat-associated core domain-containing protein [Saprospiraceae bacterium]|nr:RHS repeat-associated core domain-containing protein [Saprospiraceae bacterium]